MNSNLKHIAAAALTALAMTAVQAQTPAPTSASASASASTTQKMQGMEGMKGMNGMQGMEGMKGMNGMQGMDHSGMKEMMQAMNDKMAALPMTGNIDIDFARMMKIHHQGAIDMSLPELRDGKSPEMRKLAKNIIDAQQQEIAILDKFLAKSNPKAAPPAK